MSDPKTTPDCDHPPGWERHCVLAACNRRTRLLSPQPIATAPRDGMHILGIAISDGSGFGWFNGKKLHAHAVIHWFDDGFYLSTNAGDNGPWPATHWLPLWQGETS